MARAPARPGFSQGGSGGRAPGRFAYFRGVWDELRKVIWPTRTELWRMTGVVVLTVILFSILIGGADYGLGYAVKPIYSGSGTSSSSTTVVPATTTTATPSPSASASASPSASASASPSASASASPSA